MGWDAISVVGQLIGAVGVIASLGYLAAQIRQNTRAVRGASEFEAMNQYTSLYDCLVQTPELLEFVVRAQDPALRLTDLTPEERVRMGIFARTVFLRLQAHFKLFQNGLIDRDGWENWRSYGRGFLEPPVLAEWWEGERTQGTLTRAFMHEIDSARATRVNIGGVELFDAGEGRGRGPVSAAERST
jgi:hypothetical protein